jgi:hypothetical protein
MPKQLIYTSAPRGIVPGQSGYCTVARSAEMREALMLRLEQLSYYQHLSLSGGKERPISAYRIVDIRGTRFHVLSRIQDAGLDFTGRTNFIAHHLVFEPEEIRQLNTPPRQFPTPPVILRDWPGWVNSWTKEPQLLQNEDWAELTALTGKTNVPAQTWQRVTGDAVNGYGLLEARAGASFRVDDQTDETILGLLAESLELLEVRDTRRDFRAAAWNYTFTTSMQEQDNPADFRWRCIHSDNPAANRFATPDYSALSAARASRWTDKEKEKEETAFARTGRQPPQFAKLAADKSEIQEVTSVRLEVMTDGIPTPAVRWFEIERNEAKEMVGKSGTIQILNPEGRAKRYQVQAVNSSGSADSNVVEISIKEVNAPIRLVPRQSQSDDGSRGPAKPTLYNVKTAADIGRDRERHRVKREQEDLEKRLRRNKILTTCATVVMVLAVGALTLWKFHRPKQTESKSEIAATNNANGGSLVINSNVIQTNTLNQTAQTEVIRDTTTNQNKTTVPAGVKTPTENISQEAQAVTRTTNTTTSPTLKTPLQWTDYPPPSTNKISTNAQSQKGTKSK